jgi:hypothetical protein
MMINKHDFTFAIPPEEVGMKTGEYFPPFSVIETVFPCS